MRELTYNTYVEVPPVSNMHISAQPTCRSKSALFLVLHSGQSSVMTIVVVLVADQHTPAGLSALQVMLQQVLQKPNLS